MGIGEMGSAYLSDERKLADNIERVKDFQEQQDEAVTVLKQFREECDANPAFIQPEDYDTYLNAAIIYRQFEENHPGDVDNQILKMAENIIRQAPKKAAA